MSIQSATPRPVIPGIPSRPDGRRRARRPAVATWALLGLLAITAVWGSTFPMLHGIVQRIAAPDFLLVRFAIALVVMAAARPRAVLRLSRREVGHGLVLGLVYGLAQVAQTVGLQSTPASVSGFVTGMYVVFTPLLGALVFRRRIGRWVWAAVGGATGGLAVLSLHGFAVSNGVLLTLVGALLYGVQIIGLGSWSTNANAWGITVVQLVMVTAVCTLFALPGGVSLPASGGDWIIMLYMALVAGAFAMLVQTWAQAHIAPTKAAVTMTMEPVWAGVFAILIGGELFGWRLAVGGAMVLIAMYLVELRPHLETDADS
jgi:drug/metabolite transporter (DMT)-like permease